MTAVRELTTRLVLENLGVIAQVKSFKKDVTDLSGSKAVVGVKADVAAAKKQIQETKQAVKEVTEEVAKTKTGVKEFNKSMSDSSKEGSAFDTVMNRIRSTAANVKTSLLSAGEAGKSAAQSIRANWSDVEGAIQKVAAVTVGVTAASVYSADNIATNLSTIETARGKEYRAGVEDWVNQAASTPGVGVANRAASALEVAKQFRGLNAKQGIEFQELMEKEMLRETGDTKQLPMILQMIGTGNISDEIMKAMPGMGIDMEALKARAKAYYENPAYMRGHSQYKTEKDVLAGLFVEDFTDFAKNKKLPSGKTLADTGFEEFDTGPVNKLSETMSDISTTLGNEVLPYFASFVNILALVASSVLAIPGAAKFIAISIAIIAIVTSAILAASGLYTFATAMHIAETALWLKTKALKAWQYAMKAARLAMTLMAAHPIIAVLMGLVLVLMLVEAKTGIFSKGLAALCQAAMPAYEALASIFGLDWGKIGGNVLSGLIGALGKLFGLASGGLKGLAGGISAKLGIDSADLKSGLKVGLMAAFPVFGLAAMAKHLPSMGKSLLESLSKSDVMTGLTSKIIMWISMVYDLLKPWINIFTGLYNTLASFWEWVVTLPSEIRKILPEYLGGGEKLDGQELYDRLVKDLPEYLQGQGYPNANAEQAEWLAKALTGQDINPDDKSRLNINDAMYREAKEYSDKLSGHKDESFLDASKREGTTIVDTVTNSGGLFDNSEAPKDESFWDASKREGWALLGKIGITKNDAGGRVTKSGLGIIDAGERIETADVVREESTLEKLINVAKSGSVLSGTGVLQANNGLNRGSAQLIVQGPLIGEAKIANDLDIDALADRLMWILRGRFEDLMVRNLGLNEG